MSDPKSEEFKSHPTIFFIFGATGDLAKKRILPALFKLYKARLLPDQFRIIGTGRTQYNTDEFRSYVESLLEVDRSSLFRASEKKSFYSKNQETTGVVRGNLFGDFANYLDYLVLDITQNKNLNLIREEIQNFEKASGSCPKVIYYMAISHDIFTSAIENLGLNKLNLSCSTHNSTPRLIIEKPFGSNLESALTLKLLLDKYFHEDQIYRIDHYLGKETVQNILAFRFGNEIFEPTWNKNFIDSIQITTAEYIGVEKRGEFYDKTGALRDITQNHLLQLLSLVTMEEPKHFTASEINERKKVVLKDVKRLSLQDVEKNTVRGQYKGFLEEEKIGPKSQTETYALIKLEVDNPRWRGVPIYLRTGKKLTGKVTSIIIQFKDTRHKLFGELDTKPTPNHITLQIQPNEGIGIRLIAKKPGLTTAIEPVDMEFCYKTSFDTPQPEAYERLIIDVILGDQSLFISQEVVEECWRIIDPIRDAWDKSITKLSVYKPGSWGPKEAEELIQRDGRKWQAPLLTICKI